MIGLPPFLSFSENERILQLKILMIILRTVKNISSLNIAASVLLFLAAILAAVVANSSLSPVYQDFLLQELHLRIGNFNLFSHGGHPLKMIEFINDCLMTVFFLAVGLEIKRELLVGELSSVRKAALPFIAACGGMVVPGCHLCVVGCLQHSRNPGDGYPDGHGHCLFIGRAQFAGQACAVEPENIPDGICRGGRHRRHTGHRTVL